MKELEDAKFSYPFDLEKIVYNEAYKKTPEISEWYVNHDMASFAEITELQLKLIKHIWLNDPQFEAEKTKKYIVQIKNESAKYSYLKVLDLDFDMAFYKKDATKFDTHEEAKKWTNPLTEVVEVEE